jgi:hypothetical protein
MCCSGIYLYVVKLERKKKMRTRSQNQCDTSRERGTHRDLKILVTSTTC